VCAEEHELAGTGWLLLEKEGQQSFEKRRAGKLPEHRLRRQAQQSVAAACPKVTPAHL
jgi:hypothetical protein